MSAFPIRHFKCFWWQENKHLWKLPCTPNNNLLLTPGWVYQPQADRHAHRHTRRPTPLIIFISTCFTLSPLLSLSHTHTKTHTKTQGKHFNSSGLERDHSGLLRWKMWVRATLPWVFSLSTSLSYCQAVSISVSPFLPFSDTTLLLHQSSIFLSIFVAPSGYRTPCQSLFDILYYYSHYTEASERQILYSLFANLFCTFLDFLDTVQSNAYDFKV